MVHPSIIESRLGELGFKTSRWFNAEIRELQHILMDNEQIVALACGRYFGSFALLVATDRRLLLIDKRVFFMNIEDTRYDMISEIDFNAQVYSATVNVHTLSKTHKFTSIKYKKQLRDLTNYVQRKVMEFRNQQSDNSQMITYIPQPINQTVAYGPSGDMSLPVYQTQPMQPQPMPYQPRDYYVDDASHPVFKEKVGHIAHVVGSAATTAAHNHPRVSFRRPFNPYLQGSLVTRGSISSQNYH